jgi:hypothetical protein
MLMKAFPVAPGEAAVDIDAPPLTFKEIAHLRAILPDRGEAKRSFLQDAKPVARDAAEQFARLYRYFPSFAHVEE